MARVGDKPIVNSARKERFSPTYPENEPFYNWLRKEKPEEVLEPDLPIIDPHHHFWDFRGRQASIDAMSTKERSGQVVYKLPECLEDMNDGHNIVGTVFTQAYSFHHGKGVTGMPDAMRPLGEVEYNQGVAALCDSGTYGTCRVSRGIVSTVDFREANAEKLLKAMSGYRNFRGVRTQSSGPGTGGKIDPEEKTFIAGCKLLEKMGLSLDLFQANPKDLPNVKRVAEQVPGLTIVLNHIGGNVGPKTDMEQWKKDMSEIAKSCPNVFVKVGGGGMTANGFGFEKNDAPPGSEEVAKALLPYYGHCIDAFGAKRCMFESNFPPDKNSFSSKVCWNAFKRIANAKNCSPEDKKWLFHDTAVKAYRLDEDFYAKL